MSSVTREKVAACIHPETYRYFLEPDRIDASWESCRRRFGEWSYHSSLPMRELHCRAFILRSPEIGTPMTVLRKSDCSTVDLADLHRAIGFVMEGVGVDD